MVVPLTHFNSEDRISFLVESNLNTPQEILDYIKDKETPNTRQQNKIIGKILGQCSLSDGNVVIQPEEKKMGLRKLETEEKVQEIQEEINKILTPLPHEAVELIKTSTIAKTASTGYHKIVKILEKVEGAVSTVENDYIEKQGLLEKEVQRIQLKYPNPKTFIDEELNAIKSEDAHRLKATKYALLESLYGKRWEYTLQLQLLKIEASKNKSS